MGIALDEIARTPIDAAEAELSAALRLSAERLAEVEAFFSRVRGWGFATRRAIRQLSRGRERIVASHRYIVVCRVRRDAIDILGVFNAARHPAARSLEGSRMIPILLVALGGALGSVLRYGVNVGTMRAFGFGFPWGTLTVNVVGGFVMGLLAALFALKGGSNDLRVFLMTGVIGGFTTFSAFSLDAVVLWERGEAGLAGAYVAASVALSIAALVGGLALGRALG